MTLRERAAWLLWAAASAVIDRIDRHMQKPVPSDWHKQAERERVGEGKEWP